MNQKIRKLSYKRLSILVITVAMIVGGSMFSYKDWATSREASLIEPWFGAYVDVTATPTFAFEQMGTTKATKNAVLSFIVSSKENPCEPSWGAAYSLEEAAARLDLDRRIARLQSQEGSVAVSFGGLLNDELANKCGDETELEKAYKKVVDRYDITTIDLDIEGEALNNAVAQERRARVIASLQQKQRKDNKKLGVWVTLPVTTQGLTEAGTNAFSNLLKGGVDLAGLNIMTMNFGDTKEENQSMLSASQSAAINVHRQLDVLYSQNGIDLSDATIWKKIGLTPMIGQNDNAEEVFTVNDAEGLNEFLVSKRAGRISMWSANRDRPCGGNYVSLSTVSDSCSGIEQDAEEFSTVLSRKFERSLDENADIVTVSDNDTTEEVIDNPATSPYQIWKESGRYLQGTKVVWKRNVYEAKWWTQGDIPDNPVLQTWETPWKLVGPVLPGEKPIKQKILPKGTYPDWSGEVVYDTGQRVLFEGLPYEAKWWTKGDSPAAASSNADGSPWVPLTQKQIEELLKD